MSTSSEKVSIFKKVTSKIKLFEADLQLLTIPMLLLLIFFIIQIAGDIVEKKKDQEDVSAYTTLLPIQPYPSLKNLYEPQISAESAIIIENNSKGILYEKNPTLRFSMASTTKIMTALVALEEFHPDDILTIQRSNVEGTALGLTIGEQMTLRSLLYALLLPSANDAAYAIADNYPGGVKAFVAKMNQKAKDFHLQNTGYGDPAGLNDDEDFTTVTDLARLTSHALQQPLLAKMVSTKEIIITNTEGKVYEVENLNELLGVDGVTGFKTGQTMGAGGVLVTTVLKDNRTYILVVMKSVDRFADTRMLLTLIDNNISYFQPVIFPR